MVGTSVPPTSHWVSTWEAALLMNKAESSAKLTAVFIPRQSSVIRVPLR